MDTICISKRTARRFVLGRQGLWPGRRWRGRQGTARALTACEAVQEDPLVVVARSHDIVLHSRVLDYRPEYLERLLYRERRFFDYGGGLFIYPMSELPYWRVHMHRRAQERHADFVSIPPRVFEEVRSALRENGPLGNRDFAERSRVASYRGRKDSALAMFDLWLGGELMIHHREGFQRIYDFLENIAPPSQAHVAPEREAEDFFARKHIAHLGFVREGTWKTGVEYYIRRKISPAEARRWMAGWIERGLVACLRVDGWPDKLLVLGEDLPVLETLERERIPAGWRPLGPDTLEEVTFLAPLDIVSARSRANKLFDFEYLWEVYKPAAQRRWGYYTLPILYGDELAARLDPKLERSTQTLQIRGFWHEPRAPVRDPAFAQALAHGLTRFAAFLNASRINIAAIHPPALRARLRTEIGTALAVSTRGLA